MRCFLRILMFILTAKYITANICSFNEEAPNCICDDFNNEVVLDIKCTTPVLNLNPLNENYFQITVTKNEVKINCFASPDWLAFAYDFRKYVNQSSALILNNCTLEKDTQLSRIAEIIGVQYSNEIHLLNTHKLDTGIDFRLFQGLTNIEKLLITNNSHLMTMDKNLLSYMLNLTGLHLVNNNLREIPEDLLKYNSKLMDLQLAKNAIQSFESNTFKYLILLKQLDLSHNQIEYLTSEIFGSLINLEVLFLNNNNLKCLPEDPFLVLKNLTHLDLSSNGLDSLMENVFQNNKKLITLNLQDNRLETLPGFIFKKLVNLQILNLDNNNLKWLPGNLFSTLENLSSLNLSGNQLESFSDHTFRNLCNLKNLYLRKNKLDNLAHSAFENKKMDGFIKTSPLFIDFLEAYDTMNTNYYPLVSIFFNCSKLAVLDLAYNNIRNIYDDWFLLSKLNLEVLDLSHNSISELNLNRPLKQRNDFYVDLSHNELSGIIPSNFSNIKVKSLLCLTINIRENPFKCDCEIRDFLRYINFEMEGEIMNTLNILSDGLKCEYPEEHKGVLLSSLKNDDLFCELPFYQYHNEFCRTECNVRLKFEDCDKNICIDNGTYINNKEIYQFNCTNKNLSIPSSICIIPGSNVELDFTNSKLNELPIFQNRTDYDAITKLVLSKNTITWLKGISSFKNLEILKLENNKDTLLVITYEALIEMSRMRHLKYVSFRGSQFLCNDEFMSILYYNVAKLIRNLQQLSCLLPSTLEIIHPFTYPYY